MTITKLLAVALSAFIFLSSIIVSYAVVPDPVGYQPRFFDYSYFPIMPDEFYEKPYRLILFETSTSKYFLMISKYPFYIIDEPNNLLVSYSNPNSYDMRTISWYIFDPKLKGIEYHSWGNKINTTNLMVGNLNNENPHYYVYYINHNLISRINLNVIKSRNDIDFINVSLALCDLRYHIKNTLHVLVPVGILIFSSVFVMLRLFAKFKRSVKHTVKKRPNMKPFKKMKKHKRIKYR